MRFLSKIYVHPICNHKAIKLFSQKNNRMLSFFFDLDFSINDLRFIPWVEVVRQANRVVGGFKCETYERLYSLSDWGVACEIITLRAWIPEPAVLFTRLLSRVNGNGHSLPATRHVKALSRKIGKRKLSCIFPSLCLHPFSLSQLDLFLFRSFISVVVPLARASIRRSNKVNSLGGSSERGVPRVP